MPVRRRITVHAVDSARFCGDNNSIVVSFLNGIDHLFRSPATPDDQEPRPLPSRVMAHAYAGAQLVDAAAYTQQECVEEAAVNAAAVVACRVTALCPSKADRSSSISVRAGGPPRIIFFAGCQRLAEVCLNERAAVAVGEQSSAMSAPLSESVRRCPMQCFRVKATSSTLGAVELDVAVFLQDRCTLCTCTPQVGRVQTICFDASPVVCMGSGRPGRAEVTVVLEDGVVVVCGVLEDVSSSTWSSHAETRELGDATPSAAVCQAFCTASDHCAFHILHSFQLPPRPSSSVAPLQVGWSGRCTLWVVYSDGTVVAVQCRGVDGAPDGVDDVEEKASRFPNMSGAGPAVLPHQNIVVGQVLEGHMRLGEASEATANIACIEDVHIHADPRAPVLHFACLTSATAPPQECLLRYGTVRLHGSTTEAAGSGSAQLQWRVLQAACEGQLYGIRFERGRYNILSQGARGGGPLYVATLPNDSTAEWSVCAVTSAAPSLASMIMRSPESELSGYCRQCETLLADLRRAAQTLRHEKDAEMLEHRLMGAQHALYALLSRQQQSAGATDLAPCESLPYRLLLRASRLFRELSVYVLYTRLGIMHTVSQPLEEVLQLHDAIQQSRKMHSQWTSLMQDTFRRECVSTNAVTELAMWQAATPLCMETILKRLGITLTDASVSMAVVLARMDTLSPDMVLFLLYYSYVGAVDGTQGMETLGTGNAGASPGSSPLTAATQRQRQQWRESFLTQFGFPADVNVWAFTCYSVDHGVNPSSSATAAAGVAEDDQGAFQHVLGPAVHHLGQPPFLALMAPVLVGLAHAASLDVLLHSIPACVLAYTSAGDEMPLPVAMRLLFVAVRAGSRRMIETLYEAMRSSPVLRHLAAQPLAYAALHAGNVSSMRGWVEVGDPVLQTIEHTLQTSEKIRNREVVLLSFYILLRRYEEAMQVCTTAAPTDATQAQRLQVVLSYLRSLLSVSSEAWGEPLRVCPPDVTPLLAVKETTTVPLWRPTTLTAPLLEVSAGELADQVRCCATACNRAGNVGAASTFLSGIAVKSPAGAYAHAGATSGVTGEDGLAVPHHYHGYAPPPSGAPLYRPSTLLSSVERASGAGSRTTSLPSAPFAATGAAAQ